MAYWAPVVSHRIFSAACNVWPVSGTGAPVGTSELKMPMRTLAGLAHRERPTPGIGAKAGSPSTRHNMLTVELRSPPSSGS